MNTNTIDPIWEKIHSSREWGVYPSEHVIRFVARNYYQSDRKSTRILDYGCGGGAHTWYLAREGFDTYAFDGAPSAAARCKSRLEREGLTAQVDVMDGAQLAYPDAFFDSVIDNLCIYANRLTDIGRMYREIHRVMRRDGKLFTVCFGNLTSGITTGVEEESGTWNSIRTGSLANRGRTHVFAREEFESCLRQSGFHIRELERLTFTDRGELVEMFSAVCTKQ